MSVDVYEFSAILLLEDAIESDLQSKASLFWFSLSFCDFSLQVTNNTNILYILWQ